MNKILVSMLAALLLSFAAHAAGPGAVRKTVEASMQVTGEVKIKPEGTLESYTLDNPGALPEDVKTLLARYLPACLFSVETASGKPEIVNAKMVLQLVAQQLPAGGATISVKGSQFHDPDTPDYIKSVSMAPPKYPVKAARSGLTGTVYVVLRLNRDGSVAQAHVEQVNMTVLSIDKALDMGRLAFTESALAAAVNWRFQVMSVKFDEEDPVDVRVPVSFTFTEPTSQKNSYGKWQAYVPGPYAAIPWRKEHVADQGLGAMVAGGVYPVSSKIKLLTPTDGG